ncbi:MAG: DUF2760 domain-containing protein [Caldilineaceae bacterium]|nr:DUF2760 domain-containing protein [Caldilineaceae bacterium]
MPEQRTFTTQSLLAVLLLNALMLGALFYFFVLGRPIPGNLNPTLLFWIVGGLLTLILWLLIASAGKDAIGNAAQRLAGEQAAKPAAAPPAPAAVAPAKPAEFARAPEASAIQMLSILQRKGRLIDFLREDLAAFDDAQIGAAVRSIHDNTRKALDEYVTLEPIYNEPEGSRVTVEPNFDAYAVRLSGTVQGDPPFTGAIRHRGWRIADMELPEQTKEQAESKVIAPAEVEVG